MLILVILMVCGSPMAVASNFHPSYFKATLAGTFAFTSSSTIALSGGGGASHLGHITATGTATISHFGGTVFAAITAADGDKLFLTATGTTTWTSQTTAQFSGSYMITGGTGLLSHAKGSGTVQIKAVLTGSSGGIFAGTISGTMTK